MCGLIYVKRKNGKRANKMIVKRYHGQKTRGSEGFGFLSLSNGKLTSFYKAEKPPEIFSELNKRQDNEFLFHHRRPTSTPNYWQTAHPIRVSNGKLRRDYYLIHNGSITNADILKETHDKLGYSYTTLIKEMWVLPDREVRRGGIKWNDSESLAIELARDLDTGELGISHVDGAIAFIMLAVNKETHKAEKLFWGRNGSTPLKLQNTDDIMALTSEGEGQEVKEHTLNCYDYATEEITSRDYKIGVSWSYSTGTYSNRYENYNSSNWSRTHEQKENHFGFKPKLLDVPARSSSVDENLNELDRYLDARKELNDLNEMVSEGVWKSIEEMGDYYEKRYSEMKEIVDKYESKYINLSAGVKTDNGSVEP
jgi:glucosamine 6-phosphate synthetase-like amidotransferase/phosphosugar isomerase protein